MSRPVCAVIVAYHAADLLDRCLTPLDSETTVHVVDNSSDPDVAAVASRHQAAYTDMGCNPGFATGVNAALRPILAGSPTDVLLLNPDAVATAEAVASMRAYLHSSANARLGVVAPRLVGEDGQPQRVVWPFPHPLRAWIEAVGGGRWNRSRDFAVGAALLLRWEALQEVGLFDERFFLYAEEADWQKRAVQRGWRIAVAPDVFIVHRGAGTSTDSARREQLFHSGQETYIRKWYGSSGWAAYRAASIFGALGRAAALRGDRRRAAALRARLYLRGPRKQAAL